MLTLVALVLAFTVLPSPWNAAAVATAAVIDLAETAMLLRWSGRRRATAVGVETFSGRHAVAVAPLAPHGQVRLDGELWAAESTRSVEPRDVVVIQEVRGLKLIVGPAPARFDGK